MKIVALDIGDKRIGVAVSDPFGEYAMPSETYFRTGKLAEDLENVLSLVEEKGAELLVCGLPLNAAGEEGEQARKTRRRKTSNGVENPHRFRRRTLHDALCAGGSRLPRRERKAR